MIVFDLECSQGHIFEGWFDSVESYEKQRTQGMVSCPYCEDIQVKRVLSPVALKKSSARQTLPQSPIDYRHLAKEVVEYIHENFENVGMQFASEALKMHYGATERRNIRGSATAHEEQLLRKEGVGFLKIPLPGKDPEQEN